MKKLLCFLSLALFLIGCESKPGYQITGTVPSSDFDGKYIYLYEQGNAAVRDSALVTNSSFTFKGEQIEPATYALKFDENVFKPKQGRQGLNAPNNPVFILENGLLKVNMGEAPTVTGTLGNTALAAFHQEAIKIYAELDKITSDMKSEDAGVAEAAETKYDTVSEGLHSLVYKYIEANPNAQSAGKMLYDFRHYIDEAGRRTLLQNAGETFKSAPGVDKVIEHLTVLEKVAIGKKFTDFAMPDPKGKEVKLSDYVGKGKVVLIDFWASWCPPCRRDIPHLVEVYKQYKSKGFEIVGVSLDRTGDAWIKGIKDLNITWPQMSDLKYWQSEGAALYGVNSIPHTVLVDKDGTIIDKNLRGESLDAKLKELFN